ncbi:transcriptional regulator, TrmB [Methanolacinia petrolearia DSM 11571]|uniref:Transcriptional regulator, TrmB n=1 Tax=Methanolacinia petrolearia (strain DSM 11571 / OCM 486 / SEBR 4847) TaxID=679926 RepID=E1RFC8_METP4|nr:helix-turn-helix domain-containing protein [Methanolacinia petrolearia]ADN35076.1 transcriptional regulator, TrmB [Methanolacinia petrolearia DSM 11571]
MPEELVENLRNYGFTEYEAKAYTAIVGLGRGTAREICEISGVPQGRIYTVLNTLADRAFLEIQEGTPTFYLAENPAEVFAAIKDEYCNSIDEMIEDLRKLNYEAKPPSPFWSIHSEQGIINREKMLIRYAEHDIIIIIKDPAPLRPLLRDLKAAKKQVKLTILSDNIERSTYEALRIEEMSSDLSGLFMEMGRLGPVMKDPGWKTELFMIIDGVTAFTAGYRAGRKSATVIKMPPICFMMKRLIEILEPAARE